MAMPMETTHVKKGPSFSLMSIGAAFQRNMLALQVYSYQMNLCCLHPSNSQKNAPSILNLGH